MTKTTEMAYEMKCPECEGVYTDDREWKHCPFCGVAVDVVAVRECAPVPKPMRLLGGCSGGCCV
jgi:rRNA maturation endonuclease Nob1